MPLLTQLLICLSPKGHSSQHDQAKDVNAVIANQQKEIPTACLETKLSDIDDKGDRLESLPDVAISTQIKQTPALLAIVEHKVSLPTVNPDHTATAGPAASVVLLLSVGLSTNVTRLSSSIQNTSDHTTLKLFSSVKVMATARPLVIINYMIICSLHLVV